MAHAAGLHGHIVWTAFLRGPGQVAVASFVAHREPDLLRGNVFRTYAPQLVMVLVCGVLVVTLLLGGVVVV